MSFKDCEDLKMNMPYTEFDEEIIGCLNSDELIDHLDMHNLDEIKILQKYLSWMTNWKMFGETRVSTHCHITTGSVNPFLAKICPPVCKPTVCVDFETEAKEMYIRGSAKKEEDINMTTIDLAVKAQNHLLNRLAVVESNHLNEAQTFFLQATRQPKTLGQFRKMVADGWLGLNQDYKDFEDDERVYDIGSFLKFTDPSKKYDRAGYDAAVALVLKDSKVAKDSIMILPQTDGLKAVQEFETKTYH